MPDKNKKSRQHNSKDLNPSELSRIQLRQTQKEYSTKIKENKITCCYGPAGTSKTFTALYTALELLANGEVEEIILTKPIQEAGENLGFLPGELEEKISPYMESYIGNLNKLVSDKQIISWLLSQEKIKFKPLAYMRGDTFDNAVMVLDEAQNATIKQLMLFTTRMGRDSKIIITGDVSQYDIKLNNVALPDYIDMIKDIKQVATHTFSEQDIVRDPILKEIVKKYEKWKSENNER